MEALPPVPPRFRIVRSLGGGASGDVYEAWDRERDAPVALKALRAMQPHAIARFKNEFRALQDVVHPNLVAIGELLEERGQMFFTMELVRGVDFLTWVSGDPARLRPALADLARGLGALHAAGKVHRDVKPSNVLVTPQGRVVLLDFGLMTDVASDDTWSGHNIVGTPSYMAPEQAAGQPPGPAADWYAVGVMLYEALTGRLPHDGPLMKVLLDKQQVEPPAPETIAPDADPALAALCTQLLRFDPAERPGGEAVQRRLGRQPTARPAAATTPTHVAPFVGRDAELRVLGAALAEVAARRAPGVVVIEGDSGVGKTTLARVFTRSLEREVAVLAGRCFERESVSYKAFDGVVEAIARLLARLDPADAAALLPRHAALLAHVFPVLKRVKAFADAPLPRAELDHRELRDRVFGAVRELLIRLAERRPVVLLVDDLQWADEDSLALLAEALREPDAPPLLLVATLRPLGQVTAAALGRVRAVCPAARVIALAPLDAEASRELARALVDAHGVDAAIDLDVLSREAAGHPLLIDELVRHAASAGERAAGALRLEDAVGARVHALEPRARRVVELVALAGHPLYQDTIARAADVPAEAFGRLVATLRVANLVRTGGARPVDTLEPYHDRVRAAIAGRLDDTHRAELHRALAVAIEGSPDPGHAMLAFHWHGAGRADAAAHHAALAGARAADALAFDQAARAFRWALELGHPDRADLLARLGDALGNAGRGAEAADAYVAAAGLDDAGDALELRRRAAEQLLISGHIDRGLDLLVELLAALGMALPATPRRALAALLARRARLRLRGLGFRERSEREIPAAELTRIDLCWSVATGLAMVDTIRGADFQTRHLLLALRAGEPTRVARAFAIEAAFLATAGRGAQRRARRLIDRAGALLERTPSPLASAIVLGAECLNAYQVGEWRAALGWARRAEERVRDQRGGAGTARAWQLDTVQFFQLYSLFYLGEVDELARLTRALQRAATERGDLYAATNLRVGLSNAAWLVRGQLDEARAQLDEALRAWTVRDFHLQHYHHLLGVGQADLYAGDAIRGHAWIVERWPALERSLLLRIVLVCQEARQLRGRLALAAAREGAPDAAAKLREARRLGAAAARRPEGYARALGSLLLAGVAATRGDRDGAAAHLRRTIAACDASEMALYAAVARGRLGALLGGDEGAALVATCDEALRAQAIADPARFAAMLAPGFDG